MTNEIRPPWEPKCWGSVWHVFSDPRVAISHLRLNAGFRCSRHYHRRRHNAFYVTAGLVRVEIWDLDRRGEPTAYELCSLTDMAAGQCLSIPPRMIHRFVVLEPGEMVEVYTPESANDVVSLDDIVRLDEGGPVEAKP